MELNTYAAKTWCPGCTNYIILETFKKAIKEFSEEENFPLNKVVVATGIGCHGKMFDYLNLNGFYSIHGRVPPTLTGIKLANPELLPIGFVGDGDIYDEGISHLIHAAKRNTDIKIFVHNNMVFALTTGQFTATTPSGTKTRSTPKGSPEDPINPIELMLSAGATFVARVFVGDPQHMKYVMKEAFRHKGFAFVDIIQPCITFFNTMDFFRKRVYRLEDIKHDYTNYEEAMKRAREWKPGVDGRVPIGIFYKVRKPTFEERVLG